MSLDRFYAHVSKADIEGNIMNREKAERFYRQKFDELGLANSFEYIGRDWSSHKGRKVTARCKTCGEVFTSWEFDEIKKGRQQAMHCPSCGISSDGSEVFSRTEKAKQAAELYVQGYEQTEIAEMLGITVWQVGTAAKSYCVVDPDRKYRATRKANQHRKEEAERKITEHLKRNGFEYLGGYTDKKVRVQCNEHHSFEISAEYAGRITDCPECQKLETLKAKEQRREKARQEAETRRIERQWYRAMHPPKNYYSEIREAKLNETGVCEICGKPYTVREYMASTGSSYARDIGVCSLECRKIRQKNSVKEAHKGRQDSHRHRAKCFGCEYDGSITLAKLIKRDGLRCALCGEMCDMNDHSWSEYSGPMYPSIDHIIPMSKGGGHVWGNVQIAHIICNSYKGNTQKAVIT